MYSQKDRSQHARTQPDTEVAYLNLGARPGLKAREGELARLQTQYAELQQRQKLAAFELSDAELEAVLAAMRADVQSSEVAVARRALSLFVRRVDVDAERLVIPNHEPDSVENARLQCVPPRGFVFCASITC